MNNADLLQLASNQAAEYLASLATRRVEPDDQSLTQLTRFDEALPEETSAPDETLKLLHQYGSPATVASAGGRYFGFVIGGALPVTVGASFLANAWDQCAGVQALSPIASKLEEVSMKWMLRLLDLDPDSAVGFVTGATMANMCGLFTARHVLLKNQGWEVEKQGLFSAPGIRVIVGNEVHVSIKKALGILGLGSERVIKVPVDDQGRMLLDQLPALDDMTIVCTQAGNVNSGASDSIKEICEIARNTGAWVHVDGAFGLWARASRKQRYLVEGLEMADSIATDFHKWLNVPYDSGAVICRYPDHLRNAMTVHAAYIQRDPSRQPYDYTPGMSRRARGIEVWAALRHLGRNGVEDLVSRCCEYARMFAEQLSAAGFEVMNDVVMNQVLVSFGSDEKTDQVIAALQKEGTLWLGGTKWMGRSGMRISVSSWATTADDVQQSIDKIIEIARNIED